MNVRVRQSDFLMIMVCLLLINIPYASQTINNIFVLSVEVLLIFFLKDISIRGIKENKDIILFATAIFICTFLNHGISTRTASAFVTGLRYILLFYTVLYYCKKRTVKNAISIFVRFLGIMVILADLSIFVTLFTSGVSEHGGVYNTYIIGNKFVVSYYHMFFLALYQIELKKKLRSDKFKFSMLALLSIGVCYLVECNTGVVGCFVVILIRMLSVKKNALVEILSKPIVFCGVLIAANFILVGTDFLLKDNFVTDLLMKYSHTNKILTGRLDMYLIALNEFSKSPIIGYGINCTVVEDLLTWGNAQNGLLKIMLDFGIVGVVSFILVCFGALRQKGKYTANLTIKYGLLSFLYGMIVCSLVEININSIFIVALAMYSSTVKNNNYIDD